MGVGYDSGRIGPFATSSRSFCACGTGRGKHLQPVAALVEGLFLFGEGWATGSSSAPESSQSPRKNTRITREAAVREVSGCYRRRRKEVALGRLRTLTVLMTLSAWGAVTDGAPPDGGTPPAASSTRPDPPAPPSKYVEAGAYLFDQKQDFNLAAQYFALRMIIETC